jgi:hypothetical protein
MNWESRVLGNYWNFDSTGSLSRINHSGSLISKVIYFYGGKTQKGEKEEVTNTMMKYFINSGEYEIIENQNFPYLTDHSAK